MSEFKYFEYVLDEFGTDEEECCRKVGSGKRFGARDLQFECARVLHVPVLMYGSETMLWKEKKRCIDGEPQRFDRY